MVSKVFIGKYVQQNISYGYPTSLWVSYFFLWVSILVGHTYKKMIP